jgi:hypothetical protein
VFNLHDIYILGGLEGGEPVEKAGVLGLGTAFSPTTDAPDWVRTCSWAVAASVHMREENQDGEAQMPKRKNLSIKYGHTVTSM